MCAYVDAMATKKWFEKNKDKKEVTVYKYMRKFAGELVSPWQYTKYKPGIIKSNSTAKLQKIENREINRGIHVYFSEQQAEEMKTCKDFVVRFTANPKDLICICQSREGVFKWVKLSKEEYNKFIR